MFSFVLQKLLWRLIDMLEHQNMVFMSKKKKGNAKCCIIAIDSDPTMSYASYHFSSANENTL